MIRRVLISALVGLLLAGCGGSSSAPSRQPFSRSGTGNTVFDMPGDVARVQITGAYSGSSSNFIIWVGDRLVVNELLGTSFDKTTYSGSHAVGGGETRIENSTGVAWTITEIR